MTAEDHRFWGLHAPSTFGHARRIPPPALSSGPPILARIAAVIALVLAASGTSAQAAGPASGSQVISATAQPRIGLSADLAVSHAASSIPVRTSTERVGDRIVVTVIPYG